MKRIHTMIVVALMILGARAASADTVTSTNGGMTVTDVVMTADYGKTTIIWLADANFAASLTPNSPYWVEGINPDGSMSLSTAVAFIQKLNDKSYLGITTWRLPTTITSDTSCTYHSEMAGATFGYNCGLILGTDGMPNPGHPYSELAGLFYNVLGGTAANNILMVHNSNLRFFHNLRPYLYWSETVQANAPTYANDFWFQNGYQGTENEYDSMFVLPVSTATTGTAPQTTPACNNYTDMGASCPYPYSAVDPLGLMSTPLPPAKLTLQVSADGLLIYDPTLDVTFLANANLAGTLRPGSPYWVSASTIENNEYGGINPDGSMGIKTLKAFLMKLNNADDPYLGITGWTIPTTVTPNGNCSIQPTGTGGNPPYGYNCDGPASQLGELFYDQLSGVAGEGPFIFRETLPLNPHPLNPLELLELLLFKNLQLNYYWQFCLTGGVPGACNGNADSNGGFSFLSGYQGIQHGQNDLFVFLEVPGYHLVNYRIRPFPEPEPF